MKRYLIIILFIVSIFFLINQCAPPEVNPFVGVWKSTKADVDFMRLTANEDGTFLMEEYESGAFRDEASGKWSYTTDTQILTVDMEKQYHDDEGALGDLRTGDTEKQIMNASVSSSKLLMMAFVGGNKDTLIGEWTGTVTGKKVGSDMEEGTITIYFKDDNTLIHTIDITGTNETANASWGNKTSSSFDVSGTDNATYLPNSSYNYQLIDTGLYIGDLPIIQALETGFTMIFERQ